MYFGKCIGHRGINMLKNLVKVTIKPLSLLSFVVLSAWLVSISLNSTVNDKTQSYIISSANYQLLKEKVKALNVTPSHELAIINAVAVDLNQSQLSQLQQNLDVKVSQNHSVALAGGGKAWGKRKWQPKAIVPDYIEASAAHAERNFGDGITIGFGCRSFGSTKT